MNRPFSVDRERAPAVVTKVLIVDDSSAARMSIASTLTNHGYQVLELASAIGATRTILRHDIRAVILDVSMPGLSGDKLVGLLRSHPRLKGLVIVLVSGNESGELDRLTTQVGVDAVLPKSEIQRSLGSVLGTLLAAARRRAHETSAP